MALLENATSLQTFDKIAYVYGPNSTNSTSTQLLEKRTEMQRPTLRRGYTTYNSTYVPVSDYEETVAYRPMTSNAFRNPYNLSDPIGASHYDETYYQKEMTREQPIRTGTASGNRNNNPHPSKEFMIFRFRPMKPIVNPNSDWSKKVGDTLITQVIKNQMRSTYKSDYVNNVEEKAKFEERAKHILSPSAAALKYQSKKKKNQEQIYEPMTYNDPFSYESLYIAPTRYGCNKLHKQPAIGIVPGCSKFWYDLKPSSTD